jgi:hypothetical protein
LIDQWPAQTGIVYLAMFGILLTDCHKREFLLKFDIDLNMVRAGVVRHPGDWMYGGYHEIQNSKQRYSLINRQKLKALLGIIDNDQLSE